MARIVALTLVLLVLSGLPAAGQGTPQGAGRIEELLGVTVGPDGITFQVRSGGCTRPENFRAQRFEGSPTQVLLVRTVADRCEALVPYGTTFTVPYGDLQLDDQEAFVIVNPLATVRVFDFP